ncbi:lmo0937 family membrane protein [Alkalihalophilus lindianensis]|uniref:Lmo0937 family membrane protein n=1 Tax=Alkalihalophilus lindianensis TaxID=1630542 RepID=A0ABU3XAX9_9BACI|nr:lmo0937 family membrane protein [Alkalihalophilus lindianensis]MDV2684988.1 lmo0937 family membrane protein [Alkalihalophilus lindianensis]
MWTILIVLLILWILGFSFEIAGNLIHILLVIALVLFIFRLIKGRKA